MLKKTKILEATFAFVATCSTCYATLEGSVPSFKSGFFMGAHVGVSSGLAKFKDSFDSGNVIFKATSDSTTARKESGLYGIGAGYRYILNQGYTVGFDVDVNFYISDKIKKNLFMSFGPAGFPFDRKLSRQWSIVPSVIFGKIIGNQYHIGLGLGLGITSFHHEVVSTAPAHLSTAKFSQTRVGFIPSMSIEYAATPTVSIAGNLSYEIYNKMIKTLGSSFTTPMGAPPATYASSVKPSYLTLKMGIRYRF